jgi:hypothetical protein
MPNYQETYATSSLFLGMVLQCLSATAGNGNGSVRWGHVVPSRIVADNGGPRSPMALREQTIVAIAT